MKLVIVSSWCPCPPDNGSKIRAHALITRLARRHDVTLLSFAEPDEVPHAAALSTVCRQVETAIGSPYTADRLALRHFLSKTPRSLVQTFNPVMREMVARTAPHHDAVLALQIGAAPYTVHLPLPRVLEELEVGVVRERVDRASGLRRMRSGATWWKLARYAKTLVDAFDCTTVVSEVERSHLAAAGCDVTRVRVVSNGAELAQAWSDPPLHAALIYPGSITYSANLDAVRYFLEQIYPLIRRARPDVTCTITGETGTIDTRTLAAAPGVTFTGRVPDVRRLVERSSVCIVPLRVGGGTRLKVLEAMALGTPVVSTSKGIEGLEVTPERDVLVGDTPDTFANQVVRALNDVAFRRTLAANARLTVQERFTWDRVAADIENVLVEAVERASSGPVRLPEERYRGAGV